MLSVLNLAHILLYQQTVDGMILEKPVDKHDAYRMLSRSVSFTFTKSTKRTKENTKRSLFTACLCLFSCSLSGKEHSVFTGVVIVLCHKTESKSQLSDA